MTVISTRFRGLRSIPHVQLASLPTPTQELVSPAISGSLWVKSDDQSGERYGGNKVRKLEFVLGEALRERSDSLITVGAAGSHHAVATALYGISLGFEVHLVLAPQRWSPHVEHNLRSMLFLGAKIYPVRHASLALPRIATLRTKLGLSGNKAFVIPAGASSVAGTFGYVETGLELARQLEARVVPEFDAAVVALGTGATVAGLAVGLAAAGVSAKVVAVRVAPRIIANSRTVRQLVRQSVRALRETDDRFPDVIELAEEMIEIDQSEYGPGYGVETRSSRHAIQIGHELGLQLDHTYTAKAFASALRRATKGQRLLFFNTLSAVDVDIGTNPPPLPTNLSRLLVRH